MPLTLYRYILKELLKLLTLTAVVLVMVISFAAAIKPLSEGLLGPVSMVKFVIYTAPTMLSFALPFAGAFASTLVFLRLASDNEIQACSASGLSYRSILTPVLMLGLALTMGLFFLSNFIIPYFYRAAERTVESDLVTVLVSRLSEGQPVEMDDVVLYADRASFGDIDRLKEQFGGEPGWVAPTQWVELSGVAVGKLDAIGEAESTVTAERANIAVYQNEASSWVSIRLRNVVAYEPPGQLVAHTFQDIPTVRLPSLLRDKPKFLSWPQMSRLSADPVQFDRIRQARDALLEQISIYQMRETLVRALRAGDTVPLLGPREGERYALSAPSVQLTSDGLVFEGAADRPVVLTYQAPDAATLGDGTGRNVRRYEAQRVVGTLEPGGNVDQPILQLELQEVAVFDASGGGRSTEHAVIRPAPLFWPGPLLPVDPESVTIDQAQSLASTSSASGAVRVALDKLGHDLWELARRIVAERNQRAAAALACLLLLVLGAVLAMLNRGRMPLVVFFWSFLLAILTIIIMNTGQRMAGMSEPRLIPALALLWSGNVMLAIICGVLYCRLARH